MKDTGGVTPASGGMKAIWDAARSYRRIILRNVQVEAKVGLHPWEMHPERPARLIVNVEIFVPLAAGKHRNLRGLRPDPRGAADLAAAAAHEAAGDAGG